MITLSEDIRFVLYLLTLVFSSKQLWSHTAIVLVPWNIVRLLCRCLLLRAILTTEDKDLLRILHNILLQMLFPLTGVSEENHPVLSPRSCTLQVGRFQATSRQDSTTLRHQLPETNQPKSCRPTEWHHRRTESSDRKSSKKL